MDDHQFKELLRQIHAQIEAIEVIGDEEERQLLENLLQDIQKLIAAPGTANKPQTHSLSKQLNNSIQQFEISHPDLTRSMVQLLDILSGAGI